jgi:hypothetical protein
MATNADAIKDLEAAKDALEKQVPAATGKTGDDLMLAIQKLADEIGQLVTQALDDADYLPRTNAFKAVTADAQTFLTTLKRIKTALSVVAGLAQLIDKAISYVK